MCNQESCEYPVNAQHNLYIMINLPPSPCLSQYLLSSKSHYYTTDVRQRSHNCSHRHIWCNQRNTESKWKETLSCCCIAERGDATSTTHRIEAVRPRKYRCRNHGVHASEKMQEGFLGRSLVNLSTSNTWNLRLFTTGNQVCTNLTFWFHWKPHARRAVIRIPKFPSFQCCIASVWAAICISVFSHYKWHSYLSTLTYNLQRKT